MAKATLQKKKNITIETKLYMALELSEDKWKVGFSDGDMERIRVVSMDAGDREALKEAIRRAKEKYKMGEEVEIVSCYEAGRDGFWIHRYLQSVGINNKVFDSSSIEVDRRAKRAKTDKLDARNLTRLLIRHCRGEKNAGRVLRVPGPQDEDDRHVHRERERLKKERTGHINRIRSLLKTQGKKLGPRKAMSMKSFDRLQIWDGTPLPEHLKSQLKHEVERLELVEKQLKEIAKKQRELMKKNDTKKMKQVNILTGLRGVGPISAWILVMEFFGWREFKNRKQVGSLAGLTGTPSDSGATVRELGISKAGNRLVRYVMIELAWAWLRFQPASHLSQWFLKRYGSGGKRMRKIGIVALARKLLIALWKLAEFGQVPEGAIFNGEKYSSAA